MSVKIEPFRTDDLLYLETQERHAHLIPIFYKRLGLFGMQQLVSEFSWTAWSGYGQAVACCGILPDGGTWAFLSRDCRRVMIPVTRAVRQVLQVFAGVHGAPYADIDSTYLEAVRWAKLLGFRPDTDERWIYAQGSAS